MDDKTRLEILECWRDDPTKIGSIPPQLEGKISTEDITFLFSEMDTSGGRSGSINGAVILKHIERLRNRIIQEETLATHKKALEIQSKVKNTQLIIVAVMILTALVGAYSSYITQQNYNAQLELNSPLFEVNLHCSPMSDNNGIIKMEPKVTNHGKVGAFIHGVAEREGDFRVVYVEFEGVPQDITLGNKTIFGKRFIEGGGEMRLESRLDVKDSTEDINTTFRFYCESVDKKYPCKFITNNVSCFYHFNGTHYIHQQQCCIF